VTYWQELVKLLGGFAALVGAVAYLVKILISHFLSKDLTAYKEQLSTESAKKVAAFKADLAADNKKKIEGFKAKLDVLTQESVIRFTKLHEKRIEILSEMYLLLEDAYTSMGLLAAGCKDGVELTKDFTEKAAEKNRKLFPFLSKNKLYFSSELSKQIFTVIEGLHNSAFDLVIVSSGGHTDEEVSKRRAEFIEKWPDESSRILTVMSSIEAEFRSILASDTNPFTKSNEKRPPEDAIP